jgi:hypothetical protein
MVGHSYLDGACNGTWHYVKHERPFDEESVYPFVEDVVATFLWPRVENMLAISPLPHTVRGNL